MKRVVLGWALVAILAVVAIVAIVAIGAGLVRRAGVRPVEPAAGAVGAPAPAETPTPAEASTRSSRGFLYGRVTLDDSETFEGRLRWGHGEEAFWSDFFNGVKMANLWAAHVPPERLPAVSESISFLGLEIVPRKRPLSLERRFSARFGDLARIEAKGAREVEVTLRNGTVSVLDRYEAGDFDDTVHVWDGEKGEIDVATGDIRAIEFLPGEIHGDLPARLHGTVTTRNGSFRGFVQWDREESLGSDELDGHGPDGPVSLRFDSIRSIAKASPSSARVTLHDGGELVLDGDRDVDEHNLGVFVDDPRFGRVLVSWVVFERVDFTPAAGSGPAYEDFRPGRPITGRVATRDGRVLSGRLVFDLDESETTETLDAEAAGVDYFLPFERIATVRLPENEVEGGSPIRVTLATGEDLDFERSGDLGDQNLGLLVFGASAAGDEAGAPPEYLQWGEISVITFDPSPLDPLSSSAR